MKTIIFCIIISLFFISKYCFSQTLQQTKFDGDNYWRLTKGVTQSRIQQEVFSKNKAGVQLSYYDHNQNKTAQLKFVIDENWRRIIYGDYEKWAKSYGHYGYDAGQFIKPSSIILGTYFRPNYPTYTRLFVLDELAGRVNIFNMNINFSGTGGTGNTNISFLNYIDDIGFAKDIAFANIDFSWYLIVCETGSDKLRFYSLEYYEYFLFKNEYGDTGNQNNQFDYPTSIETIVSSGGSYIFVIDKNNKRIVKLKAQRNVDGTISIQWIKSLSIYYDAPSISRDQFCNLWVTDQTNHQIIKYDENLNFLKSYGVYGTGNNQGTINEPIDFVVGDYITTDGSLQYKYDIGFLNEKWTNGSGGIVYDLGTEITGMVIQTPKIGNYLNNTYIDFFITDRSICAVKVDKKNGSSWSTIRTYNNMVLNPGWNRIIWDGKNSLGNFESMGIYRFITNAKELYDDPNAQIQSREIIFNPLPPTISHFSQSPKPLYTNPGNVGYVYCNMSQGHGDLVYNWSYVNKPSNVSISFNGNKATMSITGNKQNIELIPMFELYCYVTSPYGTSSTLSYLPDIRSSGGGGCPFLFVQSDNGYVMDNNLLHRSEFEGNAGKDIKDVYKLKVNPVADKNKLKFQIKELNHDYSYFDRIKLYAVDHPSGTEIGVTENNDIVLYLPGGVVSTSNAVLNDKNITNLIQYNLKSPGVEGVSNERIFMNFDTKKLSSRKLLQTYNSDGSADSVAVIMNIEGAGATPIDPKEMAGTIDGSESAEKTTYQRRFARREKQSVVIVPLGNNVSLDSLNIEWFRDYDMQYAAVTPVLYGGYEKKELNLIEAVHSIHGNIKQLLNKIDKSYAELDTNGFITLTFNEGGKIKSGWTRSYVIETDGYYVLPGAGENKGLTGNSILKEQLTGSTLPTKYELGANYPNPFNPTTTIEYAVPNDGQVTVKVYDILGREVVTLLNENQSPGRYKVTWNAAGMPSGLYVYRMTAKDFKSVRKMLLIK